jgi:hypothetical protein
MCPMMLEVRHMNTKDIQDNIDQIMNGFIINSNSIDLKCTIYKIERLSGNLMTQYDVILHEMGGRKIPKNELRIEHIYKGLKAEEDYPLFVLSFHVMALLTSCVDPGIKLSDIVYKHIKSTVKSDGVVKAIRNRSEVLAKNKCGIDEDFEMIKNKIHNESRNLCDLIMAALEVSWYEMEVFGVCNNTIGRSVANALSLGCIPFGWSGSSGLGKVMTLEDISSRV